MTAEQPWASSAADRFATVCAEATGWPDVQPPSGARRFGGAALTVHGSIFAMQYGEQLVLKLPSERVQQLLGDGVGGPFGAGRRRPMREWVTLLADEDRTAVLALVREAYAFVRGTPG